MPGITYWIDVAAGVARLEKDTKDGAKHVKRMADDIEAYSNFAKNALASVGAAVSVGAFVAAVKGAAEATDAAAKMGDRFGIATEKMIGMQYAGELAHASNQAIAMSLQNIAKSGIDAARGGDETSRAYRQMNIDAAGFVKLPLDQQFSMVIDRLGKIENVALRNATAQKVLGKSYGEVMGLVAEGSAAFKQAQADAEAWGLALNRVDAAKLEMANDSITRMKAATQGTFNLIALELSPAVKALADYFADTKAKANGYRDAVKEGGEVVIQVIGYTANVVQGLRFAYVGVKFAIAEVADFTVSAMATAAKAMAESKLLEFLTYIPGPAAVTAKAMLELGKATSETLGRMAESTGAVRDQIKAQLDDLALEGLPKDAIIARIREVRAAIDKEAIEIAKRRGEMNRQTDVEAPKKDDTAWMQNLAQKAAQIQTENLTEMQLLDAHLLEKQIVINLAAQKGLIEDDVWQGQQMLLTAKYEQDKTRIVDEETKKRYNISNVYRQLDFSSSSFFFGAIAQLMTTHSRSMFEIGKAGALAQIAVDTIAGAQGAIKALSGIPIVGPAMGYAAAAAITLAGIARAQQVRSTQFGGGGMAQPVYSANPATGVPTAPIGAPSSQAGGFGVGTPAPAPKIFNITLVGETQSTQTVRDLIKQISDELVYGVDIRLNV